MMSASSFMDTIRFWPRFKGRNNRISLPWATPSRNLRYSRRNLLPRPHRKFQFHEDPQVVQPQFCDTRRLVRSLVHRARSYRAETLRKSHDSGFKAIILLIMNAKAFGDEIRPSVSISRRSRVGILFLQWNAIRCALGVPWINARGRCV